MSGVKEIEEAILKLSDADFEAVRESFAEIDAAAWDRQIERMPPPAGSTRSPMRR